MTSPETPLKSSLGSFPSKLHSMISWADANPATFPNSSSPIQWLPHGNAFIISDSIAFRSDVLPKFFPVKYSSFLRQLQRWSFALVKAGPDKGAYYHTENKFCRDYTPSKTRMSRKRPKRNRDNDKGDKAPLTSAVFSQNVFGLAPSMHPFQSLQQSAMNQNQFQSNQTIPMMNGNMNIVCNLQQQGIAQKSFGFNNNNNNSVMSSVDFNNAAEQRRVFPTNVMPATRSEAANEDEMDRELKAYFERLEASMGQGQDAS
eukprot:g667.t1 g667   contig10:496813-497797(+)